jgi:hypothetical protein
MSDESAKTDAKAVGTPKRKFDEHELCALVKQRDELSKQVDELDRKIDDQKARKILMDACKTAATLPNSAVLIDGDALQLALKDSSMISKGLVLVHDKLAYRWIMAKYQNNWTHWDGDTDDLFDEAWGVVYDDIRDLDVLLDISQMLQHTYDDAFSDSVVNSVDTGKRMIYLLEANDVGLVIEKLKWERMVANFERRKRPKA